MPSPTLGNGKICYIEIPATDIARSAEFYNAFLAGTFVNAATALLLLMTESVK